MLHSSRSLLCWSPLLALMLVACGSATPEAVEPEPVAEVAAEPEEPPIPQDILRSPTFAVPQEVFFPSMSVQILPGQEFLGHFAGLIPVTLTAAEPPEHFEFTMTMDGNERQALTETIGVAPYACLRGDGETMLENGDLRAVLPAGSVVRIVATDENYARIMAGMGLEGVVRRAALTVEGCVPETEEPPTGGRLAEVPRYTGLHLACLFSSPEPDADERGAEIPYGHQIAVLEERPGWWRVRARQGVATREGWLPDPHAYPPTERPRLSRRTGPAPQRCRTTTRAITVGDATTVAPAGSIVRPATGRYSSDTVYVPLPPGYIIIRTRGVPADALGETRSCRLGIWEPWEGYVGPCFTPGRSLDWTDADVQTDQVEGGHLPGQAVRDAMRGRREAWTRCAPDTAGSVVIEVAIAVDGTVDQATVAETEGLDATEARCVADVVKSAPIALERPLRRPSRARLTFPFFEALATR